MDTDEPSAQPAGPKRRAGAQSTSDIEPEQLRKLFTPSFPPGMNRPLRPDDGREGAEGRPRRETRRRRLGSPRHHEGDSSGPLLSNQSAYMIHLIPAVSTDRSLEFWNFFPGASAVAGSRLPQMTQGPARRPGPCLTGATGGSLNRCSRPSSRRCWGRSVAHNSIDCFRTAGGLSWAAAKPGCAPPTPSPAPSHGPGRGRALRRTADSKASSLERHPPRTWRRRSRSPRAGGKNCLSESPERLLTPLRGSV